MAITKDQQAFISRVGALASADMKKSGVPASLTIAQAILESGWGKSGLTVKANALFGIKAGAGWSGKVYSAETQECFDKVSFTTITALFRAYDSWEESVADHSALLTGAPRYKNVIGVQDYKAACRAVAAAGYATDPQYSAKLVRLVETYGLDAYDRAGSAEQPAGQPAASDGTNDTSVGKRPAETKGAGKMKDSDFIAKLQSIVDRTKTLYVMGCFGAPLTGANVSRYCTNHSYNKAEARTKMIKAAGNQNPPVFGFDCVGLIKGVLWGWNGNAGKTYGGAVYASGGVPDIGADSMITKCSAVSTDFQKIVPGEAVWLPGHIGVYIGGGKVIECSPAFKNCVQVTACLNIGSITGMSGRKWQKHGKLPYIVYSGTAQPSAGAAAKPAGSTTAALKMRVGARVQYSGAVYRDSSGNGKGKTVNGTFTVKYYYPGRKCGVHIGGLGWVPESACKVVG